jgi:pyruvate dehydrogenase kinase 2/3/4
VVAQLSTQQTTPVSLRNLYKYADSPSPQQLLKNAQFLHHEVPIRIAQRLQELSSLPYGLSETSHIQSVTSWYTHYLDSFLRSRQPRVIMETKDITETCEYVLMNQDAVQQTVALGVQQLRANRSSSQWRRMTPKIDAALNRFYMSRIGLRFLLEHHIAVSHNQSHHASPHGAPAFGRPARSRSTGSHSLGQRSGSGRPGMAGIIDPHCNVAEIAREAADDAEELCSFHLGESPEFTFHGTLGAELTYVPGHIRYMLFELLKNAARATASFHADREELPAVKVVVAAGQEDITIKISDEGGGIPRSEVDMVWSYLHSTAPPPSLDGGATGGLQAAPLAGFGVGLPLSRLYARYFGGDLQLISMEGYGTDAFLHINRLGHKCEDLPPMVLASPAESDSSLTTDEASLWRPPSASQAEKKLSQAQLHSSTIYTAPSQT